MRKLEQARTMAALLLGKPVSDRIRTEVGHEIARLTPHAPYLPGLAVILVGNDPASAVYVRNKQRACEKVGIRSVSRLLPSNTDERTLLSCIEEFNNDANIHGILVQLPLPSPEHEATAIESIAPLKDRRSAVSDPQYTSRHPGTACIAPGTDCR